MSDPYNALARDLDYNRCINQVNELRQRLGLKSWQFQVDWAYENPYAFGTAEYEAFEEARERGLAIDAERGTIRAKHLGVEA